ncbi:hypothetical protein [Planctomycetes bacterium K23_9]|uniref:Uncharacterized protein n=1 Tax=Stieleria marina TaxID=1930275 RepID=A0A517NMF6_9BACT|nr:hypothetical protein K239x_02540 [Planctomycetes bacterium K23_9]
MTKTVKTKQAGEISMLNAAKTLLFLTLATACVADSVSAQRFGRFQPKHGGHSHNQGNSSHHDSDYHGNDHYGNVHHGQNHHAYRRPVTFAYGNYHWYRGYNGHEVADIVRSRADANLTNAYARTQNEVARSARMDNSVKAIHTYIARRSINSEMRFGHLHAQGAVARAAKAEAQLVAHQTGVELNDQRGLSSDEINDLSGRLHWPLLLQMEHFNNARKPVNQVFEIRANAGTINPDHYLPLRDWIGKVSEELSKNVDVYPKADYAEAQDFLKRLLVEARLPTGASSMQFAAK